jgi:hypothetical protein
VTDVTARHRRQHAGVVPGAAAAAASEQSTSSAGAAAPPPPARDLDVRGLRCTETDMSPLGSAQLSSGPDRVQHVHAPGAERVCVRPATRVNLGRGWEGASGRGPGRRTPPPREWMAARTGSPPAARPRRSTRGRCATPGMPPRACTSAPRRPAAAHTAATPAHGTRPTHSTAQPSR